MFSIMALKIGTKVDKISSKYCFLEILSPSTPILGHNWKHDLARSCFILEVLSRHRIWNLVNLIFWIWCLVKTLKLNFGRDVDAEDWCRSWGWNLVYILKLNFGRELCKKLTCDDLIGVTVMRALNPWVHCSLGNVSHKFHISPFSGPFFPKPWTEGTVQ